MSWSVNFAGKDKTKLKAEIDDYTTRSQGGFPQLVADLAKALVDQSPIGAEGSENVAFVLDTHGHLNPDGTGAITRFETKLTKIAE